MVGALEFRHREAGLITRLDDPRRGDVLTRPSPRRDRPDGRVKHAS